MAFFLDDDEQTFEAALSFIDDFETHSEKNNQKVTSVPNSLTDNHVRSKRRVLTSEEKMRRRNEINERKRFLRKAGVYGDPNRARNAQTKEIAFLREQFEKLQLELKVLQHKRNQATETQRTMMLQPSDTLVPVVQIPSLWQKLADRQRQRREEAEEKNIRLKLAVEHHQKLANTLSDLLQKRTSQLANEYSSFTDLRFFKRHIVRTLDLSRDCEYRRLLHHLEVAYRDMDDIFASNGLANMDDFTPDEVQIRERTSGKFRYLEFFSNNILPFEVNAMKEATWAYFKGVEKHLGYGNLYKKAAKNLDEPYTIVEDLTKELFSNTNRADIRIKQVIRRYVEADRDTVIRFYRAEPVEIKHKLLSKLTYHLQGYAVTKEAPNLTSERQLSILQLCTLVFFDLAEVKAVCDPSSLRLFTDFLIAHTARNTRSHYEIIANALADEILAQSRTRV